MKLKELFESQQLSREEILRILKSMDLKEECVTWHDDNSVTLSSNLFIFNNDLTPDGALPIKFHTVNGNVKCNDGVNRLRTLKNFPQIVNGCVDLGHCKNLESLEGCPTSITDYFQIYDAPKVTSLKGLDIRYFTGGEFALEFDNVKSLVGIEKFLHLSASTKPFTFFFDFDIVTEGGIGLLLVKNLTRIRAKEGQNLPNGPFSIIEKYIGHPELLYECQAELIENGFEEFTKL